MYNLDTTTDFYVGKPEPKVTERRVWKEWLIYIHYKINEF